MPVILATRMSDCAASFEESPMHHLSMPLGRIELVGETSNDIIVMDYNRHFHRYPTASDPLLSAYFCATQGKIKESLEFAKKLHPHFHEAVALFLVRRGFVRDSLKLEGLSSWWKLKFCLSNQLLSDAVPLLKKVVEEYKARTSKPQKQLVECGLTPFINLFDLTQPGSASDRFDTPNIVHPTKEELMSVAGELASSCRSYTKPADAKSLASLTETGETSTVRALAQEILEAVSSVDPPCYFMLKAIHLVLTKSPTSSLTALNDKINAMLSSAKESDDVERLRSALLFISACIDKPDLVSTAWSKIAPPEKI